MTAGLLGAAVAPTDPAVMFSVLGEREIEGRTGTILEGESGANDPVGIALMLGLIELATHADETFWIVVRVFARADGDRPRVGIAGGFAEARLLPRLGRSAPWMRRSPSRPPSSASRRSRTARASWPSSSPA